MIVAMQDAATEEHIQRVIERMVELGFNVHRTTGAAQTILAGVGTPEHFDVAEFKVLDGVHDAYRIDQQLDFFDGIGERGRVVVLVPGQRHGGDSLRIESGERLKRIDVAADRINFGRAERQRDENGGRPEIARRPVTSTAWPGRKSPRRKAP